MEKKQDEKSFSPKTRTILTKFLPNRVLSICKLFHRPAQTACRLNSQKAALAGDLLPGA
jgi:hypothetical protein